MLREGGERASAGDEAMPLFLGEVASSHQYPPGTPPPPWFAAPPYWRSDDAIAASGDIDGSEFGLIGPAASAAFVVPFVCPPSSAGCAPPPLCCCGGPPRPSAAPAPFGRKYRSLSVLS